MSSEIFDKNIGDLVKRGALKPDAARARERFLGAVGAQPERRSWKLAAAAAAVLVVATIVGSAWSSRNSRPPVCLIATPPPVVSAPPQGDEFLRGELQLPSGKDRRAAYHFVGKSPLPEGLYFKVKIQQLSEAVSGGVLAPSLSVVSTGVLGLEKGAFDFDWAALSPGLIRIDVTAPDEVQERELVKELRLPESKRRWTFEYPTWDDRLLGLLEPQLAEIADLALEARKLVDRVEAATADEKQFRAQVKAFMAETERLQVRAGNFAQKSVYPASLREIEYTVRSLGALMHGFKWVDGKFAGVQTYYGGKPDQTHRGEAFAFAALRRYLEESVAIGGREFCLWILKDARGAGLHDAHRALVRRLAVHPGVEPFAGRLIQAPKDDLAALEAMIRKL